MSQRRSGFTLVEMVITMLIMGILAAAAMPRYFDALAQFRVAAAAARIAADLNLVRENAMSKGVSSQGEWVSFYTVSDAYQLWGDPDIDRSANEYWVRLAETAYPVDLVSANFTNKNGYTSTTTIKYDMYGCAKSGAPPLIPDATVATGQIVVASGAHQRTVVISPVTGKANVQ